MMQNFDWVHEFYRAIDRMDVQRFADFFAEDGSFRYANQAPVSGRAGIAAMAGGIFASLRGIAHEILHIWEVPGALLSEGVVTYTRLDGREVRLPFMAVSELSGAKIREYRVFVDASPLHAA